MTGIWSGAGARRVDIDLLRAVAVLSVLFFHFDIPGFSGGFLGVDIFFVISGYLISLHIQQQLQQGRFSYRMFYLRRIRRLFPAMIATLALSSVAAVFILPRGLLESFSHSQLASAVYVSNIYFWSVADYFDTESILKPLLHTWSLSVEEQFYLVWPFFLALTMSWRPRLAMSIALVGSLLAAELMHRQSASTAFYLFPFRIFEFAFGALICGVSLERLPRWNRDTLLLISLAVIVGSVMLMDEQTRNPGIATVPLCVATALVIALRHPGFNRQNGLTAPFLRIGLVSYSAYLVHWPLVVFFKIGEPGRLDLATAGAMLLVTYLLAELSYQLVERPTARIDLRRRGGALFWSLPAVLVLALGVNLAWPYVYTALHHSNVSVVEVLDRIPPYREVRDQARDAVEQQPRGAFQVPLNRILVVGDSHAVDFRRALQLALPPEQYWVDVMFSICDPLAQDSFDASLEALYEKHGQTRTHNPEYCRDYHQTFLEELAANKPDLIVFSEAWRRDTLPYVADSLQRIRDELSAEVLVMGRNLQWSGTPEVTFRKVAALSDLDREAWSMRNLNYEDFDDRLKEIAASAGAYFVSKVELVCPGQECTVMADGEFTYTDAQHWTVPGLKLYGARLLEHPAFIEALESARQQREQR